MSRDDNKPEWIYYKWPNDRLAPGMYGIEFDNDSVYEFVNTFFDALANVAKGFYMFDLNEKKIHYNRTKAIHQTERVFAYELYHQWACRLCSNKEWIINAELFKHVDWFYTDGNAKISKATNKLNAKKKNYSKDFPDMVLHKGQNKDEQMIVCEIKRKYRLHKDIKDDIDRLCLFTKIKDPKEHNDYYQSYKCGIFLCFNVGFDNIVDEVEKQFVEKKYENLNNILCVSTCYKEDNDYIPVICYQSLGNIIEQIKIKNLTDSNKDLEVLCKGLPRKRVGIKKK